MVGEPQGPSVERQLALLGGPGPGRLEDLQAADKRWSIALGPVGGPPRPKSSRSRSKTARLLGRPQVEVAAEDQRRARRPTRAPPAPP